MATRTLEIHIVFAFLTGLAVVTQAQAQSTDQPDELQAIYACKSISGASQRLACYDNSVGRFEAAERSGDVVTISKSAIEKVERDAFGFNIPSLPSLGKIFGGNDKTAKPTKHQKSKNDLTDPVETAPTKSVELKQTPSEPTIPPAILNKPKASDVTEVTLNIRKTTEFGYKRTRFFMNNGQVWEQTNTTKVKIPKIKNGKAHTAEISKGALGSFFLKINGKGAAIRVRRVR